MQECCKVVHLNGYVVGFGPRAQKSELQANQIAPRECPGGRVLPYRQYKTMLYLETYTVLYIDLIQII